MDEQFMQKDKDKRLALILKNYLNSVYNYRIATFLTVVFTPSVTLTTKTPLSPDGRSTVFSSPSSRRTFAILLPWIPNISHSALSLTLPLITALLLDTHMRRDLPRLPFPQLMWECLLMR